ncbi:hypothetical protein AURDEDRAFT_97074 [Auricularia subglabra TFB-10046 SS5]|nr:hypothetical protein AURDEDRAFT_97074 [Auricularia subglabra TFB-10046 SS5]
MRPRVHLEPGSSTPASPAAPPPPALDDAASKPLPPPPESSLAPLELSFGLVCGVCAGVFVKKGAKIIAFTLGGVFVLLQYLSINSVIRVDWQRIGSKFEQLFYRIDPLTGKKKPPTLGSLWNWLVNFLSTDFQPRATFIAGIALGLRLG